MHYLAKWRKKNGILLLKGCTPSLPDFNQLEALYSQSCYLQLMFILLYDPLNLINTIIKTTSVCDGDARSVGDGRGWLAGDTDWLAGDGGRGQPARSRRWAV